MHYTGIGSRATPPEIRQLMVDIARTFAGYGLILRSGGATGADESFEQGCDSVNGPKEISLPWSGFNNRRAANGVFNTISDEAIDMAAEFHPAWERCTIGAQRLHARNCYQVLGRDLKTPSALVVCWTRHAQGGGGTGQALRIAKAWKIPVFDLADPAALTLLDQYVTPLITGRP
jgi:hypothetical protein